MNHVLMILETTLYQTARYFAPAGSNDSGRYVIHIKLSRMNITYINILFHLQFFNLFLIY